MSIGRWLLIGLPLILVGGAWLYFGIDPGMAPRDILLMKSLGSAYVLIGLATAFDKRPVRAVATIAWYPMLVLVPVGTVLGILALRLLKESPAERKEFLKGMKTIAPEEAIRILKEQAMSRFGIKEDQFGVSLSGTLRIAPGEINGFFDDMEEDYGFSLADGVNPSTASVQDMIDVLSRSTMRREGAGCGGP